MCWFQKEFLCTFRFCKHKQITKRYVSDRTSLLCLFAVLYSFRVTRSAGPFWKERKIALVLGEQLGMLRDRGS